MDEKTIATICAPLVADLFKRSLDGLGSVGEVVGQKIRGQDPLESIAKAYARSMSKRYDVIQIFDMGAPLALTDIYTRVRMLDTVQGYRRDSVEELQNEADAGEAAKEDRARDALKVVDEHDRLVVLGKPGAGKTTFLRHLVLRSLANDGPVELLPIFVTLKELDSEKTAILDAIHHEFDLAGVAQPKAFVERLLKQGDCIVLLDGLDEVNSERSPAVFRQIQDLSDKYGGNKFVITCRVAAYNTVLERFREVEIADFGPNEIDHFSERWFGPDTALLADFRGELKKMRGVRELATTPLLLTMLCVAFKNARRLPANRAEIYREAIDALLRKWDSTRGISRDEPYRELSNRGKESLFAHIASLTFPYEEYFFPQSRLELIIAEFLETLPGQEKMSVSDAAGQVLQAIEAHHGLLVERARGVHTFSHLSIHEYFMAAYVHSLGRHQQKLLAQHYSCDVRWREVLILLACLLQDANDFVVTMLDTLCRHGAPRKYLDNLDRNSISKIEQGRNHFLSAPPPLRQRREFYTGRGSKVYDAIQNTTNPGNVIGFGSKSTSPDSERILPASSLDAARDHIMSLRQQVMSGVVADVHSFLPILTKKCASSVLLPETLNRSNLAKLAIAAAAYLCDLTRGAPTVAKLSIRDALRHLVVVAMLCDFRPTLESHHSFGSIEFAVPAAKQPLRQWHTQGYSEFPVNVNLCGLILANIHTEDSRHDLEQHVACHVTGYLEHLTSALHLYGQPDEADLGRWIGASQQLGSSVRPEIPDYSLRAIQQLKPHIDRIAREIAAYYRQAIDSIVKAYELREFPPILIAAESVLDILGSEVRLQREVRRTAALTLVELEIDPPRTDPPEPMLDDPPTGGDIPPIIA